MPKRKKSSNIHASQARSQSSAPSTPRLRVFSGIALIIIAVFLAYLPSISGGFILDDDKLITENRLIRASDGLYRFWFTTDTPDYWPVTNSTFWIEWRLWGMNSTGYHVTNLILHIVETLLIWVILRKLSIPGAFLAALIFALHPVNVESVAWISQRKNLMAMLFFLLSILWYLQVEIPLPSTQNSIYWKPSPLAPRPLPLYYWLSLAAFVLAMLSKGSVAVLPVLLLGITWWLRPLTSRDILRISPFFLVAAVLASVNVWFQTHGTEVVVRSAGFTERLLGAGAAVWFYLYKALLPVDLAFVYPQWHILIGNMLWWLPLAAAIAVTVVLWLYRKAWSRPLLFAWGFFCVALAPVLGFTDVGFMQYSLVADRYQHIALIGVVALVVAGCFVWHQCSQGAVRRTAAAVAFLTVGSLAFLTWRQSGLYHDAMTLYHATLRKNPACWMAHYNLGLELFKSDRTQEAIEHYQQALHLNPDYLDAHVNLSTALMKIGRLREAIEHFQQILAIKPDYTEMHNNLGVSLDETGRPQEAMEHYRQALRLKPDYIMAHINLGNVLLKQGRSREAIEHYEQVLTLKPDSPDVHISLANAYKAEGQYQQAYEHYLQALRIKPDYPEAQNNLGGFLAEADRPQEAIEHFKQALRLRPDYIVAWKNLASAYAMINQSTDAINAAQKALDLARSQGQAAQTGQIEDWLNSYRASLADLPKTTPHVNSAAPPP